MTPITFDGRYMAVDSQLTQGNTKYTTRKAFEFDTPEGVRTVVMGCGTWADVQDAVKTLEGAFCYPRATIRCSCGPTEPCARALPA